MVLHGFRRKQSGATEWHLPLFNHSKIAVTYYEIVDSRNEKVEFAITSRCSLAPAARCSAPGLLVLLLLVVVPLERFLDSFAVARFSRMSAPKKQKTEGLSLTGAAVIGQSGGPTVVINQSLVGFVTEALKQDNITRVLGMRHGIKGLLAEDLIDLGKETAENLAAVAKVPAAALGSVRMKPTKEDFAKMIPVLKKFDIKFFFYIGGNDSAETAHIVNESAAEQGYEMKCFHIPKTIDNDLRVTDHCPGYASAARFVAVSHAIHSPAHCRTWAIQALACL